MARLILKRVRVAVYLTYYRLTGALITTPRADKRHRQLHYAVVRYYASFFGHGADLWRAAQMAG